jgi:amino acid permease
MDFKDDTRKVANEKGVITPHGSVDDDGQIITDPPRPPLLTRLGLTADSFQQRTLADKHNQLNKTMKSRHLNMIAIGEFDLATSSCSCS